MDIHDEDSINAVLVRNAGGRYMQSDFDFTLDIPSSLTVNCSSDPNVSMLALVSTSVGGISWFFSQNPMVDERGLASGISLASYGTLVGGYWYSEKHLSQAAAVLQSLPIFVRTIVIDVVEFYRFDDALFPPLPTLKRVIRVGEFQ